MIKIIKMKVNEKLEAFEKRVNDWESKNKLSITNLIINSSNTYFFICQRNVLESSYNVEELEKALKIKFLK